jgi:adenosylcobinamide amidohydrolase
MITVTEARPWLTVDLGQRMQILSWALNRPGFVEASQIVWREVRNADLPQGVDARQWLMAELAARRLDHAVAFLTSRDVRRFTRTEAVVEGVRAACVATVGLSNAERVGHRLDRSQVTWGTINIAAVLDTGLSQAGLIEALSIAAEARTAAVIDAGFQLPTGRATGTGTDCLAIAAVPGEADHAGLHTAVGEALGAAVYRATKDGARAWIEDHKKREALDDA